MQSQILMSLQSPSPPVCVVFIFLQTAEAGLHLIF
jgi:hypothetical protein